ncbi:MAG: hypothetical protein JWM80_5423 [Cyanobacteria bacterium RYN_339]|nr:hypothetical protein [Cyanobacteria bacterium RYN_339]
MKAISWIAGTLVLAGCAAKAPPAVLTHASSPVAVAAARSLAVEVRAPRELGSGGPILTDGGVGLIRGGTILTDGGVGVVAAKLRLLGAAETLDQVVGGAGIQLVGFDGSPVGATVASDGAGHATLDVPDGAALTCLAAFKTGGKVYRLAAVIAPGALDTAVMLDPINTLVESRVRDVLGSRTRSDALSPARLKRIWTICNNAEVAVSPADLEAGVAPAVAAKNLEKIWTAAIDAKVTSAAEKAEIAAFIQALKDAAAP